jgi:plastocyanin
MGPFSNPTVRGSFLAYFPSRVTVRPGDAVRFERVETGEPHSVTLGTAVNEALARDPSSPLLRGMTLSGREPIPQNLAQPCFLEKGVPPSDPARPCAQVAEPPAFNGRQSWYSSGFIPPDEAFELAIADDIKAGKYRFACVFHGPLMTGELNVVARGGKLPTQDAIDSEASEALNALAAEAKAQLEREIGRFERKDPFPYPATAGLLVRGGSVRVNEFVPFTIRAKVGERVSWRVNGTHVISFDPPENTDPPAVRRLLSGTVAHRENSVVVRRSADLPKHPPTRPTTVSAEPYDEGTQTSGFLYSPKGSITYSISFTAPGTKSYWCLIHPGMQGLVTVVL